MITLKSRDGEEFVVSEAEAMQSKSIRHMIEDDCAKDVILLPNVTAQVLAKVIDYCKKHAAAEDGAAAETAGEGSSVPATSTKRSQEELSDWDKEFIDVDLDMLHDLFKAANYLVIDGLLDLISEKCARMIRGKSVEEIRLTFNIKNDFIAEEDKAIRDELPFAFELRNLY